MNRRSFLKSATIALSALLVPVNVMARGLRVIKISPNQIVDIESLNKWIKQEFEIHDSSTQYELLQDIIGNDAMRLEHKRYEAYKPLGINSEKHLCQAAYRTIKKNSEQVGTKKIFIRVCPEISRSADKVSIYFRMSFIPKNLHVAKLDDYLTDNAQRYLKDPTHYPVRLYGIKKEDWRGIFGSSKT